MCTVTFVPAPDGFYLTSNRDESTYRRRAVAPRAYNSGMEALIYPKDPDAGGSWIVLKEEGTAAVLLNGAFLKHVARPPYRMSRGLVLLDIIGAALPLTRFKEIDLRGIEPFTLVLLLGGCLWDCRWDGLEKHLLTLDTTQPHIWSSATLYDEQAGKDRKRWFDEWYQTSQCIATEDILAFHHSAGMGDERNGLVMNRDNKLFTVSITSIASANGDIKMLYHDLWTNDFTATGFANSSYNTCQSMQSGPQRLWDRLLSWWKKFSIRLTHWEYWPTHLVYGPIYPVWMLIGLRARSLFFFNAANPRIEYAGFTHERKSEIYRQIPTSYYPRTHFCPTSIDWNILKRQLNEQEFRFPLIAKPDIGERGMQVSLLQTAAELEGYCRRSQVDFLVQEYIPYETEAGIFYVRIPGEERGKITGIVGKEFLAVTGDGKSSITELLQRTPRFFLQMTALREKYGNKLETVLPEGIGHTLVPYGNHSRGSKFVDWSDRISDELTAVVDSICKQIPDFYFGRMDLKFANWEELLQGRNFSIIEVNGAGSEPTHIYDPRHSLFFAWKEIIRHWRLLYRVSMANSKSRHIPLMTMRDGLKMLKEHSRYLKLIRNL